MQTIRKTTIPILALFLFASCAAVLPGQDRVIVNAERSVNAAHQTVYGLYRLEASEYPFFKAKAPEQAKAVRRQVNVLRANYPKIEKAAWDAKETYRTEKSDVNKKNVQVALDVLQVIVTDAQGYITQIQTK